MKMPKEILVYICDYDDDKKPIFAVATDISEISEDHHGEKVGSYLLNREWAFTIRRELK